MSKDSLIDFTPQASCAHTGDAAIRKDAGTVQDEVNSRTSSPTVSSTLIAYIYQALKLRYGETDRSAAKFIASNIPVTQGETCGDGEEPFTPNSPLLPPLRYIVFPDGEWFYLLGNDDTDRVQHFLNAHRQIAVTGQRGQP